MKLFDQPHRRYNALSGEWVLVSPHRMERPWHGAQEAPHQDSLSTYDPNCYLCPGNIRANGERNPDYQGTYLFTNDFAALLPHSEVIPGDSDIFNRLENIQGTCKVVCYSHRHNLTLPEMSVKEIQAIISVWTEQITKLGEAYRWVQIFENKGEIMGCSNPHPHGQIWAGSALPNEPQKEERQQAKYHEQKQSNLLLDYIQFELYEGERVVVENQHWLAVVPFWAIWPYEILLIPHRHVLNLPDLVADERESLADILKRLLTKYDNLFECSFPYTMGWHGIPSNSKDDTYWQLHAHFYPPLLRSKTVKKFMVGYEMLSEAQRDLTPEQAAEKLKSLSEIHYRTKQA